MAISTRSPLAIDRFQKAREQFDGILDWLGSPEAPMDHSVLELALSERGREALRLAAQARLDLLTANEAEEAARTPASEEIEVRSRTRQIESTFGRLRFRRRGHKEPGKRVRFPLDKALNLPADLYTHPLRQRVVGEARARAFDGVVEQIDTTTGGHVPKRQAEELAVAAAQDFATFYAQNVPANDGVDTSTLLMASCDSKGIRVLPDALRDATRKEAEAAAAETVRGDPMESKKPRLHDKRMAVVTAVWEQQPTPRTPTDIVQELQRTPGTKRAKVRLARPQNKRLAASIEQGMAPMVSEMFDELDRRDPARQHPVGMLVDGDENQQTAIHDQARRRDRTVTMILDVIHMIHYLWLAGFALCFHKDKAKRKKASDVWVARHLLLVLTVGADPLIAAIEAAKAAKRLTVGQRKNIDKALKYFTRNRTLMDYPAFLARGLPIASGIIEGACRHLIQDRLGITGARWGLPGAEAILRLRAIHSSGDAEAYWEFHRHQETHRNYDLPAAALRSRAKRAAPRSPTIKFTKSSHTSSHWRRAPTPIHTPPTRRLVS